LAFIIKGFDKDLVILTSGLVLGIEAEGFSLFCPAKNWFLGFIAGFVFVSGVGPLDGTLAEGLATFYSSRSALDMRVLLVTVLLVIVAEGLRARPEAEPCLMLPRSFDLAASLSLFI
jgi:hypothetical protein